ncbi:MAG TPA: ABC transporter permease [Steroidobacteraceae bacterium]|nr:ABC transporter permease [Steroidobacteraceae bacterium]
MLKTLFVVELHRALLTQIRYPMDFVSGLATLTILFGGLLLGAQHITGVDVFNANLDGLIISYASWMMLTTCITYIPSCIQGEAQRGTLETLFTSVMSFQTILLLRAIAQSLVGFAFSAIVLLLLLWLTGRSVIATPAIIVPLLAMISASLGIGFLAGALALRFKQVSQFVSLLQFPLMFLMMTPFEQMGPLTATIASFLPVVPSAIVLRELMVVGMPLAETHYLMAVVTGALYLVGGMLIFRDATGVVMSKGMLAGY